MPPFSRAFLVAGPLLSLLVSLGGCAAPNGPALRATPAAGPTPAAAGVKAPSGQAGAALSDASPVALPAVPKNDPTGLIGKTITPPPLPKNTDTSQQSFGNNYYSCGGTLLPDRSGLFSLSLLRKGMKTRCSAANMTVAITRQSSDGRSYEFFDAMTLSVPKGHVLMSGECTGAQVAISKREDKEFLTRHLAAWEIVDHKFVPLANPKAVRCQNAGYGL